MNYSYISTLDPFSESFTNSYKSNYGKRDYFGIPELPHELPEGRGETPAEEWNRLRREDQGGKASEDPSGTITPEDAQKNAAKEVVQEIKKYETNTIPEQYKVDGQGTESMKNDGGKLGMEETKAGDASSGMSKLFGGKKPQNRAVDPNARIKDSGIPNSFDYSNFKSNIDTLSDAQKKAVHEYLNKNGEQYMKNTGIKIPDKVKEALKDPSKPKNQDIIKDYFKTGGEYEKAMEAKKSELDNREALKAKEGEPKADRKLIGKILLFLQFAATLAAALYFLNAYANAHTGCMQITKVSKDSLETQMKIMCDGDNTFTPNTCFCLYPDDTSSPEKSEKICDKDSGSGSNATEPRPVQTKKFHPCVGTVFKLDKHLYYAYQIMDPASAALDIFKKGADIAEGEGEKILAAIEKFAIIAGIVLGVLFVLFIIFKIFTGGSHSSQVPVQKVEFVPGPAPSAPAPSVPAPSVPKVTSFGRNYFGNLSKYRVR